MKWFEYADLMLKKHFFFLSVLKMSMLPNIFVETTIQRFGV